MSFCVPCSLCLRCCYTRYTHDCCCWSIMFGAILYNRFLAGRYVGHVPFPPRSPGIDPPPSRSPSDPVPCILPAPRLRLRCLRLGWPGLDTHGPLLTTQDQLQSRPDKEEHNLDRIKISYLHHSIPELTLKFGLSKRDTMALTPLLNCAKNKFKKHFQTSYPPKIIPPSSGPLI